MNLLLLIEQEKEKFKKGLHKLKELSAHKTDPICSIL